MVTRITKRKFTGSKKRFIGKPTGQIQERVQASSFLLVNRRCAWRRIAAAGANVSRPSPGVFFRRDVVFLRRAAGNGLVEQSLEISPAPAAAGSGAEALAQLARPARPLHSQKVEHFPLRDVKTEANFVVEIHVRS